MNRKYEICLWIGVMSWVVEIVVVIELGEIYALDILSRLAWTAGLRPVIIKKGAMSWGVQGRVK